MSKAISAALLSHLNANYGPGGPGGLICDLYTITFIDGYVVRLTSADQNVIFNGNTYLSVNPANASTVGGMLRHGPITWKRGVEVAECEIHVGGRPTDLVR